MVLVWWFGQDSSNSSNFPFKCNRICKLPVSSSCLGTFYDPYSSFLNYQFLHYLVLKVLYYNHDKLQLHDIKYDFISNIYCITVDSLSHIYSHNILYSKFPRFGAFYTTPLL